MRKRVTLAVVASIVLVAGATMSQAAEAAPGQGSWDIVPVTGPSSVPAVEPAKPDGVLAVGTGDVMIAEGARKGTAGPSPAAMVRRQGPRAVKVVHKPAAKTAVRRATAAKHIVKAGPSRTRHLAATNHRPPVRHAKVGKPIPVTRNQPPTKNAGRKPTVLPRV